jgi:hypothetical protein
MLKFNNLWADLYGHETWPDALGKQGEENNILNCECRKKRGKRKLYY